MPRPLLALLIGLALPALTQAGEAEDFIEKIKVRITTLDAEVQRLSVPTVNDRQHEIPRLWTLAQKLHERGHQHYYLAIELASKKDPNTYGVDSPDSKRDLNASLEACKALLELGPAPERMAQAHLFMSLVHRELGEYPEVLYHLERLTEEHAATPQAAQALMLLGDFSFDRNELDRAAKHYVRLVKRPDEVCEALARYKLGWIAINRQHWKKAAILFERVALGPEEAPCYDAFTNQPAQIELVHEALAALTFCYTHLLPAGHALEYFSQFRMPPERAVLIYEKLANRFFILEEHAGARMVYRHLLTLPADPEVVTEWKQRLADIDRLAPIK